MSDRDGLRLNELHRYRKTSSELTLEVHSHCEVPAGCGGVVLRWRRPDAAIGVSFWAYVSGTTEGFFLDGQRIDEQRVMVAPGPHVLSAVVENPGAEGFLLFRARLEPDIASAKRHTATSQADGNWRAATQQPAEGWQLPGFDDSAFLPLVERHVPEPSGNERWRWQSLQRDAKGLGLPSPAARAWLRFTFRVDVEGFS